MGLTKYKRVLMKHMDTAEICKKCWYYGWDCRGFQYYDRDDCEYFKEDDDTPIQDKILNKKEVYQDG